MSVPLINRSLTNVRTELEFLSDSEVISPELYQKIIDALPVKYKQGDRAVGVDRLGVASGAPPARGNDEKLANEFNRINISAPAAPPPSFAEANNQQHSAPSGPPPSRNEPIAYAKVSYDYEAQEKEDLSIRKNDRVAVLEHLSSDWWRGYKKSDGPGAAGVFPANYVKEITRLEFESNSIDRPPAPVDEKRESSQESFQTYHQQQQFPPQQPYQQYPPPANYYPLQQQASPQQPQYVVQQEAPQQQPQHESLFKKFGSKLGNAAIFGAGATIGSDIVNSIF